jgi:hypothetical protein
MTKGSGEKTYQMAWDCEFCGTKGLLGLDHRHCPACGSAQDETRRYFPSDEDKVAVEDHVFSGADKDCQACSSPNAAAAKHCVNCGCPMDDAGEVSKVVEEPEEPAEPKKKRRRRKAPDDDGGGMGKKAGVGIAGVLGCLGLLFLIFILVVIFWKKPVSIEAVGHVWDRTVQIEQFGPKSEDKWCDQMPSDAYSISRREEVREHDKVPDGQDCTTKRRDNGDGTYTEYQDCKTRYKDVPVYANKCRYTVDRWQSNRKVAAGGDLSEARRWPEVTLTRTGTCKGCEREGRKSQTYTVRYKDPEGNVFTCDWPEARWAAVGVGSRWSGKVGVISKQVDCGSLTAE